MKETDIKDLSKLAVSALILCAIIAAIIFSILSYV